LPRPHEDLAHHTLVDHRRGGPPVAFPAGDWCAIDVAHIAPGRIDAGLSAYETLVERARSSLHLGAAAIVRSVDRRRVVTLLQLDGHEGFSRLDAAWGERRLEAERLSVAESSTRGLYRLVASSGADEIDPESRDAYAFERVASGPEFAAGLLAALAPATGFRGVLVFGSSDGVASAIVYRFEHFGELDVIRASLTARNVLPPADDSFAMVHPVKTFA
jgi:hypothetical protein